MDLSDQLQRSQGDPRKIGQNLAAENVESLFTAEQIVQLYELHQETSKPVESSSDKQHWSLLEP